MMVGNMRCFQKVCESMSFCPEVNYGMSFCNKRWYDIFSIADGETVDGWGSARGIR
jgi:hypothetical protein